MTQAESQTKSEFESELAMTLALAVQQHTQEILHSIQLSMHKIISAATQKALEEIGNLREPKP